MAHNAAPVARHARVCTAGERDTQVETRVRGIARKGLNNGARFAARGPSKLYKISHQGAPRPLVSRHSLALSLVHARR